MKCNCEEMDEWDEAPDGAPSGSGVKGELSKFYSSTKNLFSPAEKKQNLEPENINLAAHPGTEGVTFEEAIKQCPHLAKQYGQSSSNPASASRCPYQNDQAQDWPMRAVMMFIAYNFISVGVIPRMK